MRTEFAAVSLTIAAIAQALAAWDVGEPVVTYWGGPGYPGYPEKLTERAAKQIKEGGFNVAWASSKEELDIAAKYGLRAIFDLGPDVRNIDDSYIDGIQSTTLAKIKDHPALFVYHHTDEPSAVQFVELAKFRDWLAKQDPQHPAWVNLLPTYANNEQLGVQGEMFGAYWEHVRQFGEICRPQLLSYDHYQFNVGGDTGDYLLNLGIVRQSAAALGIPFFNGVQSCTWTPGSLASPSSPRIPGPDELRYLAYTTLAYGAQGIYYYVYAFPGHFGSIANLDGTPGPNYEPLKKINRDFVQIAKELRAYRFVGAYSQKTPIAGVTPWHRGVELMVAPRDVQSDWKRSQRLLDNILITRFDDAKGPARFMIVNLDYRERRAVSVISHLVLEWFDVEKGVWIPLDNTQANFTLARGGGVLLRPRPEKPLRFTAANFIGHRGDWVNAPENSIESYKMALDQGFGVELDLYVLKDGRVVATHNAPTEGSEKDYPEIGAILDLVRPDSRFILDLKGGGTDDQLIGPIKRELERRPNITPQNVSFFGGDGWIPMHLPNYWCEHTHIVRKDWYADDPPLEDIRAEVDEAVRKHSRIWAPRWDAELLTPKLVKYAHSKGLKVAVWTINDAHSGLEALRRGCDFIMTDRPSSLYQEMLDLSR